MRIEAAVCPHCRRRMPWVMQRSMVMVVTCSLLVVVIVVVGVFALRRSGVTADALAPATHSIGGMMTLTTAGLVTSGTQCSGKDGFDDMRSGTQVLVKESSGKVIAQGALRGGSHPAGAKYASVICEFPFTVDNVPDSDFYLISVGKRGEISHTRHEMEASGWTAGFTLG
jgi:hypothetical protein